MIIEYKQEQIQVHIVRGKRKTLSISINKDGSVTLKAPRLFPTDNELKEIVVKKMDWIVAQREKQKERMDNKIPRYFKEGYTFPLLGEEYPVKMCVGKKIGIVFENSHIVVTAPEDTTQEKLQTELKKWYKKQAKEYISKRVEYYQKEVGVEVTSVSIKSRKSQWGSCDSNGNITFSWRLIMARPTAIDYVVVHELCHRNYMDHSKNFWRDVKRYFPEYEEEKEWLDKYSVNLHIE